MTLAYLFVVLLKSYENIEMFKVFLFCCCKKQQPKSAAFFCLNIEIVVKKFRMNAFCLHSLPQKNGAYCRFPLLVVVNVG